MLQSRRAFLATSAVGLASLGAAAPTPKRDYRGDMRKFVIDISKSVRKTKPGCLVVPQGGLELLIDKNDRPVADYLAAIDGVGQEEIFYGYDNKDNKKTPAKETTNFLKLLEVAKAARKTVLSIDYTNRKELADDAIARNLKAGFIPFIADRRGLDRVPLYPAKPLGENSADIKTLADAKNFLYVIDGGKFGSRQKYLAAMADNNYDLLVIDPFTDETPFTSDDLKRLQKKANGGRRLVLCYVSIGEAEEYREYWKKEWKQKKPEFLGAEDPQWKGNYAVHYWNPAWQSLIVGGPTAYLTRVMAAGFDGVYLDKVDEYEWWEEHP